MGIRQPLLICGALKLLWNARSLFSFTFEIRNRTNSVYTMEQQYLPHIFQEQMLQWCSGSVNHSPSSLAISPYSVYVVSEILCRVLLGCPFSRTHYFIRALYLLSVPLWIQTSTHPCTSHPLHSLEHKVWLAADIEHGRLYANVGGITINDPECNVTDSVMFWFAYFSVVFCIHEIYIRTKQWC